MEKVVACRKFKKLVKNSPLTSKKISFFLLNKFIRFKCQPYVSWSPEPTLKNGNIKKVATTHFYEKNDNNFRNGFEFLLTPI